MKKIMICGSRSINDENLTTGKGMVEERVLFAIKSWLKHLIMYLFFGMEAP